MGAVLWSYRVDDEVGRVVDEALRAIVVEVFERAADGQTPGGTRCRVLQAAAQGRPHD